MRLYPPTHIVGLVSLAITFSAAGSNATSITLKLQRAPLSYTSSTVAFAQGLYLYMYAYDRYIEGWFSDKDGNIVHPSISHLAMTGISLI